MPPSPASSELNRHPEMLEVTVHVGDAVIVHRPYTKLVVLPVPNRWLVFGQGVNRPGDLNL